MKTPVSETELMQRIFESDPEAVEILYDKYSPLLYTFVKKIIKNEKTSEDIIQEIFHILRKKIIYYDFNTRNPYTWIIILARSIALYESGKSKTGINESDLKDEYIIPKLSHLIEPFDIEKAFEEKSKIETALNGLTDAQQYVIYLSFYEGLTQEEIADRLKIPLTTVESKIKISMLNLNENFIGKTSRFVVKNETVELIYPFALGCLENEEKLKIYDRFKASEPFPWKLLGQYQKLVSLLPVILDLETPPAGLKEKVMNRLYQYLKKEKDARSEEVQDKRKSFEEVSPISKINKEVTDEDIQKSKYQRVQTLDEFQKKEKDKDKNEKRKTGEYEQVVPLITKKESRKIEEKETKPGQEFIYKRKKRNYAVIILIILVVVFIASGVAAYLFYMDRTLLYESQIENLNQRIENLIRENTNRPEIPGLGELKNPRSVEMSDPYETISSGKIIYSREDKRGYFHIQYLPILDANSAYQLWGNFNGNFISLGVFKVSTRPDYYPFTLPEFADVIEFYIVESNAAGSKKPGSKIYLKGRAE